MLRIVLAFAINSCLPLMLIGGAMWVLDTAAARRPCYHSTCTMAPGPTGVAEQIPVLVHPDNACGRCHEGRGTRYDQALLTVFPR